MRTTLTPETIERLTGRDHSGAEVAMLTLALTAYEAGSLDAYLAAMSEEQAWDLYDIVSDMDVTMAEDRAARERDFIVAINWIALSAKARGQGH